MLDNAILEKYKGSRKKVVVVKGTTVQGNQPHSLAESMSTHNHEEADTMIPLHVVDAIGDSTLREIDVWPHDTDVLISCEAASVSWKTSCIHQAQFPHWKTRKVS